MNGQLSIFEVLDSPQGKETPSEPSPTSSSRPRIVTTSWSARLPEGYTRIGISRGVPRWISKHNRLRYQALNPGPWFKSVEFDEYRRRYYSEILQPLDPAIVLAELEALAGPNSIPALACWEAQSLACGVIGAGLGVVLRHSRDGSARAGTRSLWLWMAASLAATAGTKLNRSDVSFREQRSRDTGHGESTRLPSRPRELHPEPLTDPDLNLSIHTARAIARRLPPSTEQFIVISAAISNRPTFRNNLRRPTRPLLGIVKF